jgi:hypothetical protein
MDFGGVSGFCAAWVKALRILGFALTPALSQFIALWAFKKGRGSRSNKSETI